MRRGGTLVCLLFLTAMPFVGCEEEAAGVAETGIEIRCANCFTFEVTVEVDGEYIGYMSSDEPRFFEVPGGSHRIYAQSTAISHSTNTYWCWSEDVSVSDGNVTRITLDCIDAVCE
jgi:hypothetical protein